MSKGGEFIKVAEREHGWLFDQDVLSGNECFAGGGEMPIIWGGNADSANRSSKELGDCEVAREVVKWENLCWPSSEVSVRAGTRA